MKEIKAYKTITINICTKKGKCLSKEELPKEQLLIYQTEDERLFENKGEAIVHEKISSVNTDIYNLCQKEIGDDWDIVYFITNHKQELLEILSKVCK